MFIAGAGGSLRSGVTNNPIKLTKSVQNKKLILLAEEQNHMFGQVEELL